MFVLGHVGIGGFIASKLVALRELRWAMLGALLPDLIDKPLYYGLVLATGKRAAELGLVSSTRTFGHTALLGLLLFVLLRRWHGAALAAGIATHLALDLLGDVFSLLAPAGPPRAGPGTHAAVFFPLFGPQFPISTFKTVGEHASAIASAWVLAMEVVGLAVLAFLWQRGTLRAAFSGEAPPPRPPRSP